MIFKAINEPEPIRNSMNTVQSKPRTFELNANHNYENVYVMQIRAHNGCVWDNSGALPAQGSFLEPF